MLYVYRGLGTLTENMQIRSNGVVSGITWPTFEFWDLLVFVHFCRARRLGETENFLLFCILIHTLKMDLFRSFTHMFVSKGQRSSTLSNKLLSSSAKLRQIKQKTLHHCHSPDGATCFIFRCGKYDDCGRYFFVIYSWSLNVDSAPAHRAHKTIRLVSRQRYLNLTRPVATKQPRPQSGLLQDMRCRPAVSLSVTGASSSTCCTLGSAWTTAPLTMQLMSGVGIFGHVWWQRE